MPLGAPVGFRPTSACTRPRSARAQRRLHALSVGVVAEALSRNRAAGDARAVGQQPSTRRGDGLGLGATDKPDSQAWRTRNGKQVRCLLGE